MAKQQTPVGGSLTTGKLESDTLQLIQGGVVVVDVQRTGGSLTVAVQISLDGGENFAPMRDASGTALSVALSGSIEHGRFEFLGQPGQEFKLVGSGATVPTVAFKIGRVVAGPS